jgi:hypothetical protein
MAKLSERIANALAPQEGEAAGSDAALKYLEVIRANLRACVEAFDRRLQFLMALILASELVHHAVVTEMTMAGLKITDLSLIKKLIPVAIAYVYYSLATAITYRRLLEEVHDEVTRRVLPRFFANNLFRPSSDSVSRREDHRRGDRRDLSADRGPCANAARPAARGGPRGVPRLRGRPGLLAVRMGRSVGVGRRRRERPVGRRGRPANRRHLPDHGMNRSATRT